MQRLPTDVVLHIISDNFHSDQDNLRTTSLLCQDARFLSQRLLYRSVVIAATAHQDCKFVRRLECMAKAPARIISYIRALGLSNRMKHCSKEARYGWHHRHGDLLNEVLRRILVEGRLQTFSADTFVGEWGIAAEQGTLSLIQQLCLSPSLCTLALTGVTGDFLRQCTLGPSLQHLIARHVQAGSGQLPCQGYIRRELRSLCIYPHSLPPYGDPVRTNRYIIHHIRNGNLDLGALNELTLSCEYGLDYHDVAQLLRACCPSLQKLDLKVKDAILEEDIHLGLDLLSNLKHLYFTTGIDYDGECFVQEAEWISTQMMPGTRRGKLGSLESVTLVITCSEKDFYSGESYVEGIRFLVNILCRRDVFRALLLFEVRFVRRGEHAPSASTMLTKGAHFQKEESKADRDAEITNALRPLLFFGVHAAVQWTLSPKSVWRTSVID